MTDRTLEKVVVLVFVVIYAFLSFVTFDQIEEDAFIYFRLAENIADGAGYVFNRGGDRVEAGSSIIWLSILVPLSWLPLDLAISSKLIGIVFGIASLGSLYRLGRCLGLASPWGALPVALTATCIPFVMWNQRGLETPVHTLAVIWLVLACVDRTLNRYWVVPAVLLLLTRSEGFFILLGLIPFLWLNRQSKREIAVSGAILASAMLLITTLRFAYFHDLVPNPFYWKFTAPREYSLTGLHRFLAQSQGYYLIAIVLLAAWRRSYWSGARVVVYGFVAVLVSWSVIAQDYMAYNRHLVPAMPLFYVVVATGVCSLAGAARSRTKALVMACFAAFAIWNSLASETAGYFGKRGDNPIRPVVLAFWSDPARFVDAVAEKVVEPNTWNYLDDLSERTSRIGASFQVLVGEFISRRYRDDAVVICDQMGQTPYHAGRNKTFIDSAGLTDKLIGHYRFYHGSENRPLLRAYYRAMKWMSRQFFPEERFVETPEGVADYLFGRKPDAIIFNFAFKRFLNLSAVPILLADERLDREFEHKFLMERVVHVYERKGAQTRAFTPPDRLFLTTVP